jgi:hypothetical protein
MLGGGLDKAHKEGMRLERFGLELGVKLTG